MNVEGTRNLIRACERLDNRKILPRILRMSERRSFPLINGGTALTDITHVNNVVDIVRLCLDADDGAWNQVYNVSNGEPISIKEWFGGVLTAVSEQ